MSEQQLNPYTELNSVMCHYVLNLCELSDYHTTVPFWGATEIRAMSPPRLKDAGKSFLEVWVELPPEAQALLPLPFTIGGKFAQNCLSFNITEYLSATKQLTH